LAADLEELITRDPDRTMRSLRQEMSIFGTALRKMVSEDLSYKSYVMRRGQFMLETSERTQTRLKENLPTSLTQQHTTLHNSTRVHKTTNVPVVFMALILNGFEGCNIITMGIGRGGPRKSRLFWAQMALASLVPFQGPPLPMPLIMTLHPSKPLRTTP
jgi:hypothetical protein